MTLAEFGDSSFWVLMGLAGLMIGFGLYFALFGKGRRE